MQLPCWSRVHCAQRSTFLAIFASYWSVHTLQLHIREAPLSLLDLITATWR